MANIKKNRQIKNKNDVQNVISSAILRQNSEFTQEDICLKVEVDIKFSPYGKYGKFRKTVNLGEMINDTINSLLVIDCIRSKGEKYILHMNFPALK